MPESGSISYGSADGRAGPACSSEKTQSSEPAGHSSGTNVTGREGFSSSSHSFLPPPSCFGLSLPKVLPSKEKAVPQPVVLAGGVGR